MPPHSLLRACSKCTTLLCSEPCHLTVSSSLFEVYDSAVFRAMPPHSLFEPVRLVYDSAVFRAMPPHSLLRACSKCTTPLCSEPCHLTVSSSLFGWCALRHSEPCHLTVSSSLFGWCALRHSEPCHLTVSYEPVRLVCPAAFRAMPPHSLLRACSAGVPCGIQSHATSQSLTSLFGAAYPPYSTI